MTFKWIGPYKQVDLRICISVLIMLLPFSNESKNFFFILDPS